MRESGLTGQRFDIRYFDGINNTVQSSLAKRTELSHAENARSNQIGSVDKRRGQTRYGTTTTGTQFASQGNAIVFNHRINSSQNEGIYRISKSDNGTDKTVVVSYAIAVVDVPSFTGNILLTVVVIEPLTITELDFLGRKTQSYHSVSNDVLVGSIFNLSGGAWNQLADTDALNLPIVNYDRAVVDGETILVNQKVPNRLLKKDGTTIITSNQAGSLYNSPNANRARVYKNRIHLADFTRNGVQYPTTIVRSSFPLGIISLVDGDVLATATTINVTDAKYFYSDSGMNTYDIYRGGTKIETITVTAVQETSVSVSAISNNLNSADEIWIAGTFTGEKQYRWVNNPTTTGLNVKQYDTFKLSGGDESAITLFETIGNVLMIGNRRNLATWDDYNLQNLDLGIGCVSSNGYTKLLGTLYFLDYGGVYASTGGIPSLISRKVERYIKGATRAGLESSTAGYLGLSVFFTIGDTKLYADDGSLEEELENVTLEYNIADQNWYVHTNFPLNSMVNYVDEAGVEHLLASSTAGNCPILDLFTGNTDDGKEIFMRVDTSDLQMTKEFDMAALVTNIITEMTRGSQVSCFISIDNEEWQQLSGRGMKGVSVFKTDVNAERGGTPPVCRKLKISLRDSSKQICRLTQISALYTPSTFVSPSA